MKKIIKSPAKINLLLDVGEKLNNYHEIFTIMQTVSFYDTLVFDVSKNSGSDKDIIITSNKYFLPIDEKNLCFKCIKYIKGKYNIKDIIKLHINKYIPMGGGLGGGSSNCYFTIKFLNDYYKLNLSINEIQNICNQFGSDISFFSIGGTCLCEGRGEKIKKINDMPKCFILLVNPNISISTKEVYDEYDAIEKSDYIGKKNSILNMMGNNKKFDLYELCDNLFNSLEDVVLKKEPKIKEIKKILMANNAIVSLMTGSGSTVFGIFDSFEKAKNCQKFIINNTYFFSIICKPI